MKYLLQSLALTACTTASLAAKSSWGPSASSAWSSQAFHNLVIFGDSYSDESRLTYFLGHNYTLPPPGTLLNQSLNTASGGRIWNRYVVQYTGSSSSSSSNNSSSNSSTFTPSISLYNYAVGGGVCSNSITPRHVVEDRGEVGAGADDEIPGFLADVNATNPATGKNTFDPALQANDTVYVVWTGGNDLGEAAFITTSQVPGTSLVDYLDCLYVAMDRLYAAGARFFVLPNQPPFELAPLYANDTEGGIDAQTALNYWPGGKPDNHTLIAETMREFVVTTNDAHNYRIPFALALERRYSGAHVAQFDMYSLFYNIHQNPNAYLNGTRTPYNTTAYAKGICNVTNGICSDPGCCDSFMWFDSLHKSEQTDRNIAKEFVNLLNGNSSYATYW